MTSIYCISGRFWCRLRCTCIKILCREFKFFSKRFASFFPLFEIESMVENKDRCDLRKTPSGNTRSLSDLYYEEPLASPVQFADHPRRRTAIHFPSSYPSTPSYTEQAVGSPNARHTTPALPVNPASLFKSRPSSTYHSACNSLSKSSQTSSSQIPARRWRLWYP